MEEQVVWVIEHRTVDPQGSGVVGVVTPSETGDRTEILKQWVIQEAKRYDYGSGYFAAYDIQTNSHELIDSNIAYFTLEGEILKDQPL